jgi:hypothetical protein
MSAIGRDRFLAAFKLFPDATQYVISGRLARAESAAASMPASKDKQRVTDFLSEGRDVFNI